MNGINLKGDGRLIYGDHFSIPPKSERNDGKIKGEKNQKKKNGKNTENP